MTDTNYVVTLSIATTGTARWAEDDNCRYLMPQSKTVDYFWIDIRRCAGPQVAEPVQEADLLVEWIAVPAK